MQLSLSGSLLGGASNGIGRNAFFFEVEIRRVFCEGGSFEEMKGVLFATLAKENVACLQESGFV